MKILHIIESMEIGGAQRLLKDLIPIQNKSNKVGLLILRSVGSSFEKAVFDSGIKVYNINSSNIYSPVNILHIRKVLKDWDIVHVHLFPALYWTALASTGLDKVLIYTEHSTHNKRRTRPYFRPIEKWVYSRYEKIICISDETKDNLEKWLKIESGDRLVTINNGVALSKFDSAGIQPENIITMVSRFAPAKDHATLIRAMKWVDPDYRLVLAGDGETRAECEKLAEAEGLIDRIDFLGTRSDIAEIIKRSYIGVQSSKWEGFGLTAVEFMAAGKPVVCSDVPGLSNVVGNAGLHFKVGDSVQLAKLINYLIQHKDSYSDYSKRGYERSKNFSILHMNDKYSGLYNTVIQNLHNDRKQ